MKKSYRDILRDIYQYRKKINPKYTIASFSKDAGFKSYHMSDILSGRYGLSFSRAVTVAERLDMPDESKEEFLYLVSLEGSLSNEDKQLARNRSFNIGHKSDLVLFDDQFDIISKWYYLAVLELSRKQDFVADSEWISKKLNIKQEDALDALSKLSKFNYICFNEKGQVDHQLISVRTNAPSSSSAIRAFHKSMIQKGLAAIEEVGSNERHLRSFNVLLSNDEYRCLSLELSDFIRKKIVEFQKSRSSVQTRLHAINTQIFPLENF